jgi:ribosomal protein L7Ae-like RNA K-turn-binding protein
VTTAGEAANQAPLSDAAARRLLGLVGLGVRGRLAVVGVERVRQAAKRRSLALAIVAPDASRHSLDKILPLLTALRVHYIQGPAAAALGAAAGREATTVVGIVDWNLAKGIREVMESDPERGPEEGG